MSSENITFSVEVGELTSEDIDESSELAERFFNMASKPDEIPASEENKKFILEKIPDCDNVIKSDGKIIEFTFVVPCNKSIMNRFLSNDLTEKELFEEVKLKINYDNFDTIYLCSSFIEKGYRGRGLAVKGRIMSIKTRIGNRKINPILFSWPQTKEGEKSVRRTASVLGLELKIKPYEKQNITN